MLDTTDNVTDGWRERPKQYFDGINREMRRRVDSYLDSPDRLREGTQNRSRYRPLRRGGGWNFHTFRAQLPD